jgi:radical SAM-linked protein
LSTRWAIRCSVEGDLRFASHHDLLRAAERIARRAKLPLRYSQGFNPRPGIVLPTPRPVGVTSLDDRILIDLNEPIESDALVEALNSQSPEGLTFLDATEIDRKNALPPERITYEFPLDGDVSLDALLSQEEWIVQRKVKAKKSRRRGSRSDGPSTKPLNIRPLVCDVKGTENSTLTFSLVGRDSRWAKPTEVLAQFGWAGPEALARLVRTHITDELTQHRKDNHE